MSAKLAPDTEVSGLIKDKHVRSRIWRVRLGLGFPGPGPFTLGDLTRFTADQVSEIPGVGDRTVNTLKVVMARAGYSFRGEGVTVGGAKQGPPVCFRPGPEFSRLVSEFAVHHDLGESQAYKHLAALAISGLDWRHFELVAELAEAMGGRRRFVAACLRLRVMLRLGQDRTTEEAGDAPRFTMIRTMAASAAGTLDDDKEDAS